MSSKTKYSNTRRAIEAYDRRAKHALRKSTPTKLVVVAVLMVGLGVLGLAIPLTAIAVTFFGTVESIRLARPSWYPFRFSKRLLYGLRLGTALYLALGVIGIIVNWSDIYPYVKPLLDWINT